MKQDWIARQLKAEIIVGTFLLVVFLGVGYFTIILSRESWFTPKHTYEVAFRNIQGLREGDSVVVRGMPLGKVRQLVLATNAVHVSVALDQELTLHEGYRARIVPTSVLGGHYLEINEGPETNAALPVIEFLQGEEASDLIADASEVVSALKRGMVEGGMVDNLAATLKNIRTITDRLEAGQGTLGKLLSTDDQLYRDVASAAESIRKITTRVESGQGTLGKLLSEDDKLYRDLSATGESLKNITARLDAGEGTLGKLMAKDDPVYDDLAATMKSLKNVTASLEHGDGVLGKLITDKELGKQVSEIITEVRATVDDMRESTPVVTFSSIFFGVF
ncbi:MAG: MlaD family protein [Lentisphaerae bacterium]|nr:MlaD family protein [Lentisphaerota bacterium]